MRRCCLFFTLLIIHSVSLAQDNSASINLIRKYFKAFEYNNVIQLSEQILAQKELLPDADRIELYTMRAVSFYANGQMNQAMTDFIAILKINPEFSLDPINTSPKILAFFNDIKANFIIIGKEEKEPQEVTTQQQTTQTTLSPRWRNTPLLCSMLLPGWGHLKLQQPKKGWTLMSLSLIQMGLSARLVYDTSQKERAYLNETNKQQLETKYDRYNAAYKARNVCLVTFATFWLYSQVDLLYFTPPKSSPAITASVMPLFTDNVKAIQVNIVF